MAESWQLNQVEGDKLIYGYVQQNGPSSIPNRMQAVTGESLKLRWIDEQLKRAVLSRYEALKLLDYQSRVAHCFHGHRTHNPLKNHFHGMCRSFAGVNKYPLHGMNLKLTSAFRNAVVEPQRILTLSGLARVPNISRAVQSHKWANYNRYIKVKVAESAKEAKYAVPQPQAEGYNMEEKKNVNQILKVVKPMNIFDVFSSAITPPNRMIVEDEKDKNGQKKPVKFIDFLGVGDVEQMPDR